MKQFIEDKAPKIKNLKIEYLRGANPSLVMKSASMGDETVSIGNWKQDDIDQYLSERLK